MDGDADDNEDGEGHGHSDEEQLEVGVPDGGGMVQSGPSEHVVDW